MAKAPTRVKTIHPDLRKMLRSYELIEDCLQGEPQVKSRTTRYLPKPNAKDTSPENVERYAAYVERAVFVNVSRRTQQGLLGAVFETATVVKVPSILDPIVTDASGGGISLEQLSSKLAGIVLGKGRSGLFVDYPDAPEAGVSKLEADELRPNITNYEPKDIINWRVEEVGGIDILTLVVLHETYIANDDGFEEQRKDQYRELRLVGGQYIVRLWRNDAILKTYEPQDSDGKKLTRIPFFFIGAEDNDADVDYAPMYDLCALNIAHYRNSADFEEAVYQIGQPTIWLSGLTQSWVQDVFHGRVETGSRAAVLLPENGQAGIIQVQPNTMAQEAMEMKERQMVALGARLVEQRSVERTATEAVIEDKGENSVLASVAKNCTAALEAALRTCMLFLDASAAKGAEIIYKINTAYGLADLPPDELANVISAWQGRAISFSEMRQRLRYGGLATMDDKAAKTEIEKEIKEADAREIDKGNQTAEGQAKAQAKFPKPTAGAPRAKAAAKRGRAASS